MEGKKLFFYDIERQKFIAECTIENIHSYRVVDEELILRIKKENIMQFKKMALPFSHESRNGDYLHYTPIESILPNPFTSIDRMLPDTIQGHLQDLMIYPSGLSQYQYAIAPKSDGV